MAPKRVSISGKKQLKKCKVTFFYIVNLGENPLHGINADNNGAYTQARNTSTMFYCNDKNVRTVYKDVGKLYFNEKVLSNKYQKIYISKEDVVTLHRRYCKGKSFPLNRIAVTVSSPKNGLIIPYAAVLYQTDSAIKETTPALYHSNSKKEPCPYIRTSQEVLSITKDVLKEGASCKETYDKINSLSGGIYKSCSESNERRNVK